MIFETDKTAYPHVVKIDMNHVVTFHSGRCELSRVGGKHLSHITFILTSGAKWELPFKSIEDRDNDIFRLLEMMKQKIHNVQ